MLAVWTAVFVSDLIYWLMKNITNGRVTGVLQWVDGQMLEDVDYVDDLALVLDDVKDA